MWAQTYATQINDLTLKAFVSQRKFLKNVINLHFHVFFSKFSFFDLTDLNIY